MVLVLWRLLNSLRNHTSIPEHSIPALLSSHDKELTEEFFRLIENNWTIFRYGDYRGETPVLKRLNYIYDRVYKNLTWCEANELNLTSWLNSGYIPAIMCGLCLYGPCWLLFHATFSVSGDITPVLGWSLLVFFLGFYLGFYFICSQSFYIMYLFILQASAGSLLLLPSQFCNATISPASHAFVVVNPPNPGSLVVADLWVRSSRRIVSSRVKGDLIKAVSFTEAGDGGGPVPVSSRLALDREGVGEQEREVYQQ